MVSRKHCIQQWVFLACAATVCLAQQVYYVTPNNATACPSDASHCKTLGEYVQAKEFQSNRKFFFLSGTHTLDMDVNIRGGFIFRITNLSLIGDDKKIHSSFASNTPASNIQCTGKVGFIFFSVQAVLIANLSFTECGTEVSQLSELLPQTLTNYGNVSVALGFALAIDVNLSGVLVQNSTGFGIGGVDVLGSTYITNSVFVYNKGDENSPGGNAIFLFALGQQLCPFIGTFYPHVDFTISSSHFLYGSSNSLPGGLQIILQQECSQVKIRITNTSISHNINLGKASGANLAISVIQQDDSSGGHHITVENCHIEGGKGYGSAGISLAVVSRQQTMSPLGNCIINTTNKPSVFEISNTWLIGNNATHTIGGGLGIILDLCHRYSVSITNVTLTANVVRTQVSLDDINYSDYVSTGGNAFIGIAPALPVHSVIIKDSTFNSGVAIMGGGLALAVRPPPCTEGLASNSSTAFFHELVSISNTSFTNNTAASGGAVGILTVSEKFPLAANGCSVANALTIQISECNFTENYAIVGSALAAQEQDTYNTFALLASGYYSVVLSNCSLLKNRNLRDNDQFFQHLYFQIGNATQATIFLQYVQNFSLANCEFINNNNTALKAEKSNILLEGNVTFMNNTANRGGGISLLYSYLFPKRYTQIYFTDNHANEVGGGIYIQEQTLPFSIHPCFLRSPQEVAQNETGILLHFDNNSAETAGSAIYGGYIDMCSTQSYNALGFWVFPTRSQSLKNLNFTNQPGSSVVSSDPLGICFCHVNNEKNCSLKQMIMNTYPGANFSISLVTVGQRNGTVPGVVRAEFSNVTRLHSLGHSQDSQSVYHGCTNATYTIFSGSKAEHLKLTVENPAAYYAYLFEPPTILVELMDCPFGFTLENSSLPGCDCVPVLKTSGVTCDITTLMLHRPPGVWLGYTSKSNSNLSQSRNASTNEEVVVHKHCPFHYCKPGYIDLKVTGNIIEDQCAFNRSGILCGKCRPGFSIVLGSSRCKECENWSIVLLLVFTVAGLVLVAFLAICNLTIVEGTLSGLIFYTNIIQAGQSTFIGFPCQLTVMNTAYSKVLCALSVLIAWLNLDLGIETCFYNSMDMYYKVWLQFAFPVYVWILAAIMIISSHYSIRASKIFGRNSPKVLATLFLLSYAKILDAVLTVFSFTFLDYPDGRRVVWLYDANIEYMRGKHIALFIAAFIFTVVFLFPYTFTVLLIPCLQKRSGYRLLCWVRKLKPILDAYTGPYKDKYRFWTGLMLLARLTLLLAYAVNSLGDAYFNVFLTGIVVLFLIAFECIFLGIYKRWSSNILETTFLLNLALLCIATLYVYGNDGDQTLVALISTGVASFTCTGIITYHAYARMKQLIMRCFRKLPAYHQMIPVDAENGDALNEEEAPSQIIRGADHNQRVRRQRLTFDESRDEVILVTDN